MKNICIWHMFKCETTTCNTFWPFNSCHFSLDSGPMKRVAWTNGRLPWRFGQLWPVRRSRTSPAMNQPLSPRQGVNKLRCNGISETTKKSLEKSPKPPTKDHQTHLNIQQKIPLFFFVGTSSLGALANTTLRLNFRSLHLVHQDLVRLDFFQLMQLKLVVSTFNPVEKNIRNLPQIREPPRRVFML